MNKQLTPKQKKVLSTINDFFNKNAEHPTLEDLRVSLGLSQLSSVQRHTDALKEKGYLTNSRKLSLPTSNSRAQIPLVGNVACGAPLLAVENIEAYISFNTAKLRGQPDDYFFLRAVGDSMNKANIFGKTIDDGDLVLIRKRQSADPGSCVVALISDEATIKKYFPEDGHIRLQPESTNSKNKPLLMFEDFSIQGIVEDVIKKGN